MKRVLFQPFDLGKWFILGFTAWLSSLLDGSGSGGSGGSGGGGGEGDGGQAGAAAWEWITEHLPVVIMIGALLLVILLAIILALLWVSSRGKFMFLDNVVHNRAEVKAPWKRFRTIGNSLFRWRLVFGFIVFGVILLIAGGCWLFAVSLGTPITPTAMWATVISATLVLVTGTLAVIYITILLEDFVIPLMYKYSLTTNEAWKRFLELHGRSKASFVLYALWKTLLSVAAGLCIILLGCGTLCVGFLLMIIPYVGTVFLLPFLVFFRLLGPEFLRQFGGEYDIFSSIQEAPTESI
jgi:hypothetical protein